MDSLIGNLFILALLLWILGKSASWALRSAIGLARALDVPELVISLIIITFISLLPEATISVISAFQDVPTLGLGTILGSNVADLTFVFGIMALFAKKPVAVESAFLKKDYQFLALLLLPLILGFNGHYSRLDGLLLVGASIVFFLNTLRDVPRRVKPAPNHFSRGAVKTSLLLAASLIAMGISAYAAVSIVENAAQRLALSPALIGLLVVALGTTLPELFLSIRAAATEHPTLALGDIMGTVVIDITLVLGIIALIQPYSFNPRIVILTGTFVLLAGLFVLSLMRSERRLTKTEGAYLFVFYLVFVMIEFVLRDWTPLIIK